MPIPEARISLYRRWLRETRGLDFETYDELWRWSVTDLRGFWRSIWQYFDVRSESPYSTELIEPVMPGAVWFPGARVNVAAQVFRHAEREQRAGQPAILHQDERMVAPAAIDWPTLQRRVGAFARSLRELGVQPGDRVGAYLPNTPETVIAFLACASLGAIWSVCAPEMGPLAVLDRFRQIRPKVLIAVCSQQHGGRRFDRSPVVEQVCSGLDSLAQLVLVGATSVERAALERAAGRCPVHDFETLAAGNAPLAPVSLPFDHPLWIVYSSGTTGLPKPIVHGHGGIMLEMLKVSLHHNLGPSSETGDRFHWYSSTGWIMWNAQVGALLGGTTICLYDGHAAGTGATPDWGRLWRFADAAGVTMFGAGAAFYASCLKAGLEPLAEVPLAALRGVGSTGSPLSDDCYQWIWDRLPRVDGRPMWIHAISGGTDFAGAFIGGIAELPVTKGQMQCRCLGAAVESWSDPDPSGRGRPLVDEVGELVCTQPMPSMPLYLWGDADNRRYRESYFEMYPGVWRHGDWIRLIPHPETGATGAIIYGRSDATINRFGIRMGTAELYRAVEALPEVVDSLVVDLEYLGRESYMPLFVVLRAGCTLDSALEQRLRDAIRTELSPRHVPSEIVQVAAVPRTLSGKKMELPVKKLLQGAAPETVLHRDAMANPESVPWFAEFARRRAAAAAG